MPLMEEIGGWTPRCGIVLDKMERRLSLVPTLFATVVITHGHVLCFRQKTEFPTVPKCFSQRILSPYVRTLRACSSFWKFVFVSWRTSTIFERNRRSMTRSPLVASYTTWCCRKTVTRKKTLCHTQEALRNASRRNLVRTDGMVCMGCGFKMTMNQPNASPMGMN